MNIDTKIRETVTMERAFDRYCPEIKRRNRRMPCPIHGGTHDNLSYTDRVFCCHTCNAGGDVITFVMLLFHLNRAQAIQKLAVDFRVQSFKASRTVAREAEIARKRYQAERDRKLAFHKLQVAKLVEVRRTLWNNHPEAETMIRELDDLLDRTDQGDDVPDANMFTEDVTDLCIKILLPYVEDLVKEVAP